MMRRAAVPLLALLIPGCVEKADIPTVPEQTLPMQLSTSLRDLPRGQSATLTVSLTNVLEERVELFFETSCQVILFIKDQGNRLVARRRTDDCARVPSLITLEPSQTTTFTFIWSGESELGPPGSGTPLPAGTYFASAEMLAANYIGIAFPITIELLN